MFRARGVIGVLAATMALVSGSASAAVYWSPPAPVTAGFYGSSAVSCASSSFCMAVDSYGTASTFDGTSWGSGVSIDPGSPAAVTGVSCPSATFCAAVDGVGRGMLFNGSSWAPPTVVDPLVGLTSVSCTSSTFCAAVDHSGHVIVYDGTSWGAPQNLTTDPFAAQSISCVSPTFCAAGDNSGGAVTFDGAHGSARVAVDSGAPGMSVSCASASFCAAVDNRHNAMVFDGAAWTAPVPLQGLASAAVSCVSPSFCAEVDHYGSVSTFDGLAWTAGPQVDTVSNLSFNAVSCATSTFCVAVDGRGYFSRTATGGPQQITFTTTPPAAPQYGGTYNVGVAGGGSPNPVVLSIDASSASGACLLSGTLVHFTGLGTCVIDADQAGSTDYFPATRTQQSLTVGKAATQLSPGTPTYAKSKVTLSATLTSAATGRALAGQAVTFTTHDKRTCQATTNDQGVASCSGLAAPNGTRGRSTYTVTFAGDSLYQPTSATANF